MYSLIDGYWDSLNLGQLSIKLLVQSFVKPGFAFLLVSTQGWNCCLAGTRIFSCGVTGNCFLERTNPTRL